jgi:hypothetical protein
MHSAVTEGARAGAYCSYVRTRGADETGREPARPEGGEGGREINPAPYLLFSVGSIRDRAADSMGMKATTPIAARSPW